MSMRFIWKFFYSVLIFSYSNILLGQDLPKLIIDSHGHTGLINDIIFINGGKELISVSDDKTIRFWNVETGNNSKTLRPFNGETVEGKIYAAALSKDERFLAIGGFFGSQGGDSKSVGTIRIIDLQTQKINALLIGHDNVVNDLAFSEDNKFLVSAGADKTIRIWQASNFLKSSSFIKTDQSAILQGHSGSVTTIAISNKNGFVVSGSEDKTIRVWDLSSIQIGQTISNSIAEGKYHTDIIRKVIITPDDTQIITGSNDGKVLQWTAKAQFLRQIDRSDNQVNALAISSSGRHLVALSQNGKVYDLVTKEAVSSFTFHNNAVSAATFAPFKSFAGDTATYIASAGGDDKNIFIWKAATGKPVRNLVGKGKSIFAVGHKDNQIAFGTSNPSGLLEQCPLERSFDAIQHVLYPEGINPKIYKRNVTEYATQSIYKKDDQTLTFGYSSIKTDAVKDGIIRCYSFTPDNNFVLVGSTFSCKLFKKDGTYVKEYKGHIGEIWALSISDDQKYLYTSSSDQTIKIWNFETGENLATYFYSSDNEWILWTPQGYYAASAGGEKYIGWQINKGRNELADYLEVTSFREKYLKPLIVSKTIQLGSFSLAAKELNIVEKEEIVDNMPPQITWISPNIVKTNTDKNTYLIKANINSSTEIINYKLLVNGKPYATKDILTVSGTDKEKEISFELKLNAASANARGFDVVAEEEEIQYDETAYSLAIFAENKNANTVSPEYTLVHRVAKGKTNNINERNDPSPTIKEVTKLEEVTKKTEALPQLYLLTIGISNFKNPKYNLNYADDDALAVKNAFENQQGKLFSKVNSFDILNEKATRENILKTFQRIKTVATAEDVVIVFIATHGINKDNGFYILPHDGDASQSAITCVDWHDFSNTIGNLPSQTLLFIDACHSGQLGTNIGQPNNTEAVRKLSSREYGVVIMAASTGAETSLEHTDWKHGAFTFSLIEGLEQGKADLKPDGTIYIRELDFYIAERVKELTGNRQHPTTQKPSSISELPVFVK